MNEMIERVANILLTACESDKGMLHPWKPFDVTQVAKQCIQAMREPTEVMTASSYKFRNINDKYRAMIDEALK